jgi:hypothetical protein
MAKAANRRTVSPHPKGWAIRANKATRASEISDTRAAAISRAREILRNSGGGELTVKDERGRIVDSDTVPPGNDSNPPRDKK